jgi:hypothetical protein
MAKKFILEDFDCNKIVFDSKERALKKALEWLEDTYNKEEKTPDALERKIADMTELIESYANPHYEGFSIDDYCWCYEADYIPDEKEDE